MHSPHNYSDIFFHSCYSTRRPRQGCQIHFLSLCPAFCLFLMYRCSLNPSRCSQGSSPILDNRDRQLTWRGKIQKSRCLLFSRLDAVSVVMAKHTHPPKPWGQEKPEWLEELRQSIPEKDLFYFPLICEVFRQEKQPEDRYWKMNQRTAISAILVNQLSNSVHDLLFFQIFTKHRPFEGRLKKKVKETSCFQNRKSALTPSNKGGVLVHEIKDDDSYLYYIVSDTPFPLAPLPTHF